MATAVIREELSHFNLMVSFLALFARLVCDSDLMNCWLFYHSCGFVVNYFIMSIRRVAVKLTLFLLFDRMCVEGRFMGLRLSALFQKGGDSYG